MNPEFTDGSSPTTPLTRPNFGGLNFANDLPFTSLLCCDQLISRKRKRITRTILDSDNSDTDDDANGDKSIPIPWIEKYSPIKKAQLAVDSKALEKIGLWLGAWKKDIKDGNSRKNLNKRKRRDSDSDFVTSDEEESELKTKCLLLHGQTGCGKTATVSTLANQMGFKVVEVNFSTPRPGKDVLKRVEEATLSHRLESKQSCLLLFKDVCLVEPKEDVGFGAAVAQLITTSCRPIVMTMTAQPHFGRIPPVGGDCDSLILDAKIEKKEPLPVYFVSQPPSVIVQKVLAPIVRKEFPNLEVREIRGLLYSIARHCKGDIRRSINQLQFFIPMYKDKFSSHFHNHLVSHIDIDFVSHSQRRRQQEQENVDGRRRSSKRKASYNALPTVIVPDDDVVEKVENDVVMNGSNQKKSKEIVQEELKPLTSLVKGLEFAIDLDRVTTFIQQRSHNEMNYDDDLKTGRHHVLMDCFTTSLQKYCSFTGDSLSSLSPQLNHTDTMIELKNSVPRQNGKVIASDTESEADSVVSVPTEHRMKNDNTLRLSSLIFANDEDVEREIEIGRLTSDMEEYCGTVGDFMACGQFNYHNFAYVRTIIKTSKLKSVGPCAKRNRRVSSHFNRVPPELIERVCDTFDFKSDLKIANSAQ